MLSILNRGGNVVTRTAYNPFVKRDLNYGFSHGNTRNTYHPYWTNSNGFDLKKRAVEQPQLPVFEQTRHWDSWAKKGKQREFNNSQLNWWLILGVISGAIGLWGFTEVKAEEKKDEDEKHVKLNEKNYQAVITRLRNNDPNLLSLEVQIKLNEQQLRVLYEAVEKNTTMGYIAWHKNQVKYDGVGLINKKLEENNRNYRYYPNDYVHALLSMHSYSDSKEKDVVTLDATVDKHVKDWRVEKVYDDTDNTGYYGVIYVNDKTHQIVLASRGTEEVTLKKLLKALSKTKSDWKANLEEIVGGKIIVGQQAWNYLATEEAVKLVKEKGYHLSFTGHSLGAWLAELGAFYCHGYFKHRDVKAVTFDSPGSKQMMEKIDTHIEGRDTKVNKKDIEIVTYLAAPNPVNSCNEHVGKVYRVDREMEMTKWMDNKVPIFVMNRMGGEVHGSLSVEGHMLGGILSAFDPETGKPKNYIRIGSWPRLEYKGKTEDFKGIAQESISTSSLKTKLGVEIVSDLISDTTIMSFVSLFINIGKGKIYQEEYWEYFKHIDLENADGKSKPKQDLSFDNRFALTVKAHYREEEDEENILKLSKGSVDQLLYDLHHSKGRLHAFKDLPESVREQLGELASSFEVEAIDEKGTKYKLIPVKEKGLDVDLIKQRIRRLIKVIPKGRKKLERFFIDFKPRDILDAQAGTNRSVEIIPDAIPSIRNLKFVGRKGELGKIEEELSEHNMVIICGTPGIGKTSLVKEYAHNLVEKGKQVRWISATYLKIADEYAKLAGDLKISTGGLTIEEVRDFIYGKLSTLKEPVYLILDNIDKQEELERFLKNKPSNIKILITTRDERLLEDEGYQQIKLAGLVEKEAVEYIIKSLNISDKEAKELAHGIESDKHKGVRPISLYLAVHYLNRHLTKTVREYIEERRNHKGTENNPDIEMAISSLSNSAREVLKYCAYLDADNISVEILKSIIKDDNNLDGSISELRGAGLVSLRDRESLSLHREVQDTARNENKDTSLIKELFDKIDEFFPDCTEYDRDNVEKAKRLVRSTVSIAEVVKESSIVDNERIMLLLFKLGDYYKDTIIDLRRSLSYYIGALTVAEKFYSNNHHHTAYALNHVGVVYEQLGDLEQGLKYKEKALQMRQALYSGNHADLANSLSSVGIAYANSGDLKKGLEYQEKALQMRQALYFGNHPDVADSFSNVGAAHLNSSDLKKGLEYQEKALQMRQALYFGNHPAVAASLNNVGIAYEKLGNLKKGQKYLEESLQMRQALHSGNHPSIAISLNNLGMAYKSLGDFEKGLKYLEEGLQMRQALYPGNHPSVAGSLSNVGIAYEKLGDLKKELKYKEKALQMRQALYPENHPDVAISIGNVGIAYENLGDLKKGLEYQEKALQIYKVLYDGNHPLIADSLNNLGIAYQNSGDLKKALEHQEKAMQMWLTLCSGNDFNLANPLNNLGEAYHKFGDYNKALEYYKQAYGIALAVLGSNHPDTVSYRKNVENLQPNFFDTKPRDFVELLFSEECNEVGAECRAIISKRGGFEATTFHVKERLQMSVLNKIQQNAAEGYWSYRYITNVYDWGVSGYIEDSYIKKELGLLDNESNIESAKMLCFEAMNLGIMKSLNKPYHVAQEFTKDNPELVKKIAIQHPEYFVDGSIVEACIRAMPNDLSFKEHLHEHTGVRGFKARERSE